MPAENMQIELLDLSDEMLLKIAHSLDLLSLIKLGKVNSRFRNLSKDVSFWKDIYFKLVNNYPQYFLFYCLTERYPQNFFSENLSFPEGKNYLLLFKSSPSAFEGTELSLEAALWENQEYISLHAQSEEYYKAVLIPLRDTNIQIELADAALKINDLDTLKLLHLFRYKFSESQLLDYFFRFRNLESQYLQHRFVNIVSQSDQLQPYMDITSSQINVMLPVLEWMASNISADAAYTLACFHRPPSSFKNTSTEEYKKWLKLAADTQHLKAMQELADCLYLGIRGFDKDSSAALELYTATQNLYYLSKKQDITIDNLEKETLPNFPYDVKNILLPKIYRQFQEDNFLTYLSSLRELTEFRNQCPVTILNFKITREEAYLVRIPQKKVSQNEQYLHYKYYYISYDEILKQIQSCPFTRHVGEYSVLKLSDLNDKQLAYLMASENSLIESNAILNIIMNIIAEDFTLPWQTRHFQLPASHFWAGESSSQAPSLMIGQDTAADAYFWLPPHI